MCWEKRAHAAWDAADRAKRQTVIAAVAREQAEKAAEDALTQALNDAKLSQKEPHLDPEVPPSRHKPPGLAAPLPRGGQPPVPYTPPPGSPEAALLEGDLIIPGKHPRAERELPPQPPHYTAPPWDHGAGAYQPHVERPPWLDDQAFDAEVGKSILLQGGESSMSYPDNSFPSWIPENYRDPNSIIQIPLALSAGGTIDIPHASSVIGMGLVQWGSSFFASLGTPAHSLAELHAEMGDAPPTVRRWVHLGPFSLSGKHNVYGSFDYEISIRFGGHKVSTPNGVNVDFSRSFAFRGESLGPRPLNRAVTIEYNYLDYTADSLTGELPSTAGQAGFYVKIMLLRTILAIGAVALIVAAGYGLAQIINTSPLKNPVWLFGK